MVVDVPLDDSKSFNVGFTVNGLHGSESSLLRRDLEVVETIGDGDGAPRVNTDREGIRTVGTLGDRAIGDLDRSSKSFCLGLGIRR